MNADSPAPAPTLATPRSRWSDRILLVFFAAVVLPVGTSILYTWPPSAHSFYPRCPLQWITGFHCPGCGATRCVHALLHLDLPQAFAYNSLFVLALPLFAYAGVCTVYSMWTGKHVPSLRLPRWAVVFIIVLVIAYGILRNIDVYPCDLLAPHQL